MSGAFSIGTDVERASYLLIDDVMTTGATAGACALALRDAGAVQVWVLTAARAFRRGSVRVSPVRGGSPHQASLISSNRFRPGSVVARGVPPR